MILYIEKEILFDHQCRELYFCDNELNEEYLILSSIDQCSCKKQPVILCKYDHDLCQIRCLQKNHLFLKQNNQSNEIWMNNHPINVVVLNENELKQNSEIIYICEENNLPKPIFEHVKNRLNFIENASINQTFIVDFLLKYSILAQSIYSMYLTLHQARRDSFQLRRYANLGYLFANIFVGILCSFILFGNFDLNRLISNEILIQTQDITTRIKYIIEWLMHAPAGLKLNQPLVDFLARFYFYHIYLWSGHLEALVINVLPYLYQILFLLCFFGISVAIGAMCDFIRLLTIHLYCFYIYAARLFNWQIRLLIILFRLFCGKKQNPLRNNRLDSHLCDLDQLFIVTLTFTILLFLLPSVFMYYAVFTSIWIITVLTVKIIQYFNQFLLQLPVYEFYLWITGSEIIQGMPRFAVNYAQSTDNIIMMNNGTLTLFDRYDVGCELGKGTYGIVRKAFDTRQQHDVAIKCVCLGDEGIPSTALREISLLRSLKHPNIIRLYDIQVHQPTGELFLFYECMEMDLYEYMKLYRKPLPQDLSKSYLKQMLLGIDHIHSNSMLHRDLKPQNILIDWIGSLKLADFGLGRHFQMPMRMYTHEVVTLWYRSPEILLGAKTYSTSVDLWSIGTIFAEITHNRALFAGECEIDQLFRIFRTLGTPDDVTWPGFSSMPDHKKTFPQWKCQDMAQLLSNFSPDALQLTLQMLIYDPDRRITAKAALESTYFQSMPAHPIIPPQINQPKNVPVNPNSTSSTNQSDI